MMRMLFYTTVGSHEVIVDKLELAGTQGASRQKGAVRKVILLNWRGIIHSTMTMIITNYVYPVIVFALTLVNLYLVIDAKIAAKS
jgi:hypothetical protein